MIVKKYDHLISEPILIKEIGMIYETEKSKKRYRYGLYKCDCGNTFKARMSSVKYGTARSCGCLVRKATKIVMSKNFKTHGLSKHRLYNTWIDMKARCTNRKSESYPRYGGRGIEMCKRWFNIENFIEDMYPTFKEGLSIDRIDNDGNYEPSNCRWATDKQQAHNKSKPPKTNTSGYVGVWFRSDRNKYQAELKVDNKKHSLGCYKTALEGAKAREEYIIKNNLPNVRNF